MSPTDVLADAAELHEGEARRRADRAFTLAATPRGCCRTVLDHAAADAMREQVGWMRHGMAEFDPADIEAPIALEAVIIDNFMARMRELLVNVRQRGRA